MNEIQNILANVLTVDFVCSVAWTSMALGFVVLLFAVIAQPVVAGLGIVRNIIERAGQGGLGGQTAFGSIAWISLVILFGVPFLGELYLRFFLGTGGLIGCLFGMFGGGGVPAPGGI